MTGPTREDYERGVLRTNKYDACICAHFHPEGAIVTRAEWESIHFRSDEERDRWLRVRLDYLSRIPLVPAQDATDLADLDMLRRRTQSFAGETAVPNRAGIETAEEVARLRSVLSELCREIARYREALKKYGSHLHEFCPNAFRYYPRPEEPCHCGLNAFLFPRVK